MDYWNLVKRTWEIVKNHRFLWWLGILAGATEGGFNFSGSGYQLPANFWQGIEEKAPLPIRESGQLVSAPWGKVLGASTVSSWLANYWLVILIAAIFLGLIVVAWLVLSLIARAGMVASVEKIEKGESVSFGRALALGAKMFWRMLGVSLLFGLMTLGLLLVLAAPTLIFIFAGSKIAALTFGIILLVPMILGVIYLSIWMVLAVRAIVLEGKGVLEGMSLSRQIFHLCWQKVVIIWLIAIIIGLVFGLAIGFGGLLIGLPIVGLTVAMWFVARIMAIVFGALMGLVLLAALLVAAGFTNAYVSTFWTLAWLELKEKNVS